MVNSGFGLVYRLLGEQSITTSTVRLFGAPLGGEAALGAHRLKITDSRIELHDGASASVGFRTEINGSELIVVDSFFSESGLSSSGGSIHNSTLYVSGPEAGWSSPGTLNFGGFVAATDAIIIADDGALVSPARLILLGNSAVQGTDASFRGLFLADMSTVELTRSEATAIVANLPIFEGIGRNVSDPSGSLPTDARARLTDTDVGGIGTFGEGMVIELRGTNTAGTLCGDPSSVRVEIDLSEAGGRAGKLTIGEGAAPGSFACEWPSLPNGNIELRARLDGDQLEHDVVHIGRLGPPETQVTDLLLHLTADISAYQLEDGIPFITYDSAACPAPTPRVPRLTIVTTPGLDEAHRVIVAATDGEARFRVIDAAACLGDVTGELGAPDGRVTAHDLLVILDRFNAASLAPGTGGDANSDGVVDTADLLLCLANFNDDCTGGAR